MCVCVYIYIYIYTQVTPGVTLIGCEFSILTNPSFDYITFAYSPYLQNFKVIKDQ